MPGDRVLRHEQVQQLAVLAEYSDGSMRDVTRQSEYSSNLDVVATVDADGLVHSGRLSGEAAVMARHMGYVAVFRALVPHGEPLSEIPEFKPANYIDELTVAKWKKLGLRPSPTADDATFLRRVTVDLCGRLPTTAEARAFLTDTAADKRAKLIDRLLDSPDYPAYLRHALGQHPAQLEPGRRRPGGLRLPQLAQGHDRPQPSLRRVRARHRGGGRRVAGRAGDQLVLAEPRRPAAPGDRRHGPGVSRHSPAMCRAAITIRYERWGQADYYGLAGFFTRLGRKSFGEPPPYYASASVTTGEKNPLTGKTPEPKYLDGTEPKFTPEDDPRHALVDWMARPDNPFFASALVNRLWGHFLGRGLYHEVDDLRETNPPSNPELLDALAKDFIEHKFDVKHVIRTILNSRVYQLSSEPTPHNKNDRQNFARYYGRRLLAEVFLDAVNQTTGAKGGFTGVSSNARAVDLPHEGFGSYFLDTFDRPRRVTGCECERSSGATLAQVLLLANSEEIENKIATADGRVAKLMKEKKPIPADRRGAVSDGIFAATDAGGAEAQPRVTSRTADRQATGAGRRAVGDPQHEGIHVQSLTFSRELLQSRRDAVARRSSRLNVRTRGHSHVGFRHAVAVSSRSAVWPSAA